MTSHHAIMPLPFSMKPMEVTNAGQQDPSSVVPYKISTQERAGQLIDKANKAGVISDQTAIDIAGEVATTAEALDPYAVANMPTDLKIGFRLKMLAILVRDRAEPHASWNPTTPPPPAHLTHPTIHARCSTS